MTCALVKPTSGYRTFSRLVSLSVRFSIWTSTEVSLATFAHHLCGRLVDAEALEGRRPQLAAPLALAIEPAPDHQLLAVAVLDLQPRAAAPPWLIARVELLGHDAFEARLGARVLHRLAAAHLVWRSLP